MSLWLFNIYVDDVAKEVNVIMLDTSFSLISTDDRLESVLATVCRQYCFGSGFREEIISAGGRV